MRTTTILTRSALILLTLVAGAGALFAAGYAYADLPLATAVGATGLWLVLTGVLAAAALRRIAVTMLTVAVVAIGLFTLLDSQVDLLARDSHGPVAALVVLAAFVPLGLLGLHHPTAAGALLTVLAVAQLAATFGLHLAEGAGAPPFRALLGGSSGVVILPMLVGAALLVLAGRLDHEPVGLHPPRGARHAPLRPLSRAAPPRGRRTPGARGRPRAPGSDGPGR